MNKVLIIRWLIIFIFASIMYTGVKVLFFDDVARVTSRFYIKKISSGSTRFSDRYICELLKKSGYSTYLLPYYRIYENVKIFIIIFLALYIMRLLIMKTLHYTELIIILMLLSLSVGRLKILKYYTPVGLVFRYLDEFMKRKLDREIYSIIIQLQNISEAQNTYSFNLTYILTKIIRFANLTKGAFVKVISCIDVNETEEAKRIFEEEVNTELAKNFVSVIMKLDYIQPAEIKTQLKVLEEKAKNNNAEIRYKSAEFISNIFYLIPTVLCFLILINFLRIIMNLVMGMIAF